MACYYFSSSYVYTLRSTHSMNILGTETVDLYIASPRQHKIMRSTRLTQ
jgi:hypothetical protein